MFKKSSKGISPLCLHKLHGVGSKQKHASQGRESFGFWA
jgi:hypothetical protein